MRFHVWERLNKSSKKLKHHSTIRSEFNPVLDGMKAGRELVEHFLEWLYKHGWDGDPRKIGDVIKNNFEKDPDAVVARVYSEITTPLLGDMCTEMDIDKIIKRFSRDKTLSKNDIMQLFDAGMSHSIIDALVERGIIRLSPDQEKFHKEIKEKLVRLAMQIKGLIDKFVRQRTGNAPAQNVLCVIGWKIDQGNDQSIDTRELGYMTTVYDAMYMPVKPVIETKKEDGEITIKVKNDHSGECGSFNVDAVAFEEILKTHFTAPYTIMNMKNLGDPQVIIVAGSQEAIGKLNIALRNTKDNNLLKRSK